MTVSDKSSASWYVDLIIEKVFKADTLLSNTDLKRFIGLDLSAGTEVVCCVVVRPVPEPVGAAEEISLYFLTAVQSS